VANVSGPALRERLAALWEHLGLTRAHVATQMPGDVADFAAAMPGRIGGMVLVVPTRLDPAPFDKVGGRLLTICGSHGLTTEVTARAVGRLQGARRLVLENYDAPGWADVVADRTDAIVEAMIGFLEAHPADSPGTRARTGTHAGITWRIEGEGPALVLLPFFLAPSQWAPAVSRFANRFSVITLGGPHLGGVAILEDRANAPTYRAMVRALIDLMDPRPGEAILDVGAGSGALDRLVAGWRPGNPVTAVDTNAFLLSEGAALARAEGLGDRISFEKANAERLPFADATFGCAFSVTVLEECDADLALREMMRVVKPGGRIGVIVRSIDLPQWWHVAPPEGLAGRMAEPPQSVGGKGVADAGLYRRARAAGLADLVCFPALVTLDNPAGPIWRYREDHLTAQLTAEETRAWRAARDLAADEGLLFMAHPMHCVVGRKP
jgi:SAM-dependent methyltransferase